MILNDTNIFNLIKKIKTKVNFIEIEGKKDKLKFIILQIR